MIQTTRGEVLEKGVAIEAGISGILGYLLDIEVETSKSFGHQSFALSLSAKVNLLSDLKFVPKEIGRQFQLFTEIRNKFAHVQAVDTFNSCFEVIKDQKKYFVETFAKHLPEGTEEEIGLKMGFDFLCLHLGLWMQLILSRSHYLKIQEVKKTTVVEMMRGFLKNLAPKEGTDQDKDFLTHIDNLVKEIEQDKDFMPSAVDAVKAGIKDVK